MEIKPVTAARGSSARPAGPSARGIPSARGNPSVRGGEHLATFPHEGRLWDAFMSVADDAPDPERCRARIRFLPADRDEGDQPLDTAVLIIEPSYEQALQVARRYQRYELSAFLRSII